MRFSQIVAVTWLLVISVLTPAHAEKRVALVVGNAAYRHADKLDNPVNDAQGMRDALKKLGFGVIYGENLDLKGLGRAIGQFAGRVEDADVAIVYFAGHGSTFDGTSYVVPVDAEFASLTEVPHELIPVETLIGDLRRAKGVRIAILDACRDNGSEQELKRQVSRGGGDRTRGLAPIRNTSGLIIAYATQYGATAADNGSAPGGQFSSMHSSAGHSPFTLALLNDIATPGLDVKDMFYKVGRDVIAATDGRQRPEISVSMYDQFALVPGNGSGGTPSSPTGHTNVAVALPLRPVEQLPARPAPQSPALGDGTLSMRQKAVLYEEDSSNSNGIQFGGSAGWHTERLPPGTGRNPEVVIRGEIEIPEQKVLVRVTLRRNDDKTLPASHTVDIQFKLPPEFSHGSVANIPGILVKQGERNRGTALAGVSVKVRDNFFLVGLSSAEAEMHRNVQLLKDRPWLEIPFVCADGKRALIAIEKGPAGERAFAEAFAAWEQIAAPPAASASH